MDIPAADLTVISAQQRRGEEGGGGRYRGASRGQKKDEHWGE